MKTIAELFRLIIYCLIVLFLVLTLFLFLALLDVAGNQPFGFFSSILIILSVFVTSIMALGLVAIMFVIMDTLTEIRDELKKSKNSPVIDRGEPQVATKE